MPGLLAFLFIVLWIGGFLDAILADADRVRVMPKAIWVVLILIFSILAVVPWFLFGRPQGGGRAAGTRPSSSPFGWTGGTRTPDARPPHNDGWQLGGAGGRRRSGPVAPDDDPEFLRQLGKRPKPGDGDSPAG
jgi:hypothetical protein